MASIVQLCREYGMPYRTVQHRIYDYGWDLMEALETPVMSRKECCKKAWEQSAFNKRFIGDEKHKLIQTLDDAYYQRVRRAVKKGVSWREAVKVCKEPFGARYAGY